MPQPLRLADEADAPLVDRPGRAPSAADERVDFQLRVVAALNASYCLIQLGTAVWYDSLALLSDAFHNMSDVIAVLIALWAHRAKHWGQSSEMTFGWIRAEVLGGLINGVFLLGMCFYVLLQALPRFWAPMEIDASWTLIGVAVCGIPINLAGVFLFCGAAHGHSHGGGGGHGHSHGGGGHGHSHGHSHAADENNLNLWAVFAHSLGDAAASAFVAVGGLLIHYFDDHEPKGNSAPSCRDADDCQWTDYVDPAFSVVLVCVIMVTIVPLIRSTAKVLLEATPDFVDLAALQGELEAVPDVAEVADLHVMQMGGEDELMAIVKIVTATRAADKDAVVRAAQEVLHRGGVHSATVQATACDATGCCSGCSAPTTVRSFSVDGGELGSMSIQ